MTSRLVLSKGGSLPLLAYLVVVAGILCAWPLVAYDTDLFAHLTGGRYLVAHGRPPDAAFFSFLPTGDTWIDYFWLFQAMVYATYSMGGFTALIMLRAMVYVVTVGLIYLYLRGDDRDNASRFYIQALLLTVLYSLAILPRELNFRPHCFSYLLIILFHLLVEKQPRWAWALPVLAVFWVNVHGIEYPVMLLLCGAYLAEYFWCKLRRRVSDGLRRVRWPLIVSLYAVLATPFGLALLPKPFAIPLFQDRVILEMMPQELAALTGFVFYPLSALPNTARNLCVVGLLVGGGGLIAARRLRMSRLVLLAGAIYLLTRYQRLAYESILLLLPIAGDVLALCNERRGRPLSRVATPVLGLMTLYFSVFWWTFLPIRPAYPLDPSRLPTGSAAFLDTVGTGGRILNQANSGGYLAWRLYPKYKIFMTMETFFFSNFDLFENLNAFGDPTVLRSVLEHYAPDWIIAQSADEGFAKRLSGHQEYIPVFFDDQQTVYVHKARQPEIATQYNLDRLLPVTPANWERIDFATIKAEKRSELLATVRDMLSITPDGIVLNALAAKLLLAGDRPAEAREYATTIVCSHPDNAMGYALLALADFAEERYQQALTRNELALDRAVPGTTTVLKRNLYACLVRLGEYRKAMDTLLEVVSPMAGGTTAKDLYDLSLAAVACGRGREGRFLLDMARLKTPDEASWLKERIEEFSRTLAAEGGE